MIKLLCKTLVLLVLFPIILMGQNIDHLQGKWQDSEKKNRFDLEVDGNNVRWKNEKSENWNKLTWVSGSEYVDKDDYKYVFDEKKGTVKVINPDNAKDIRAASMVNFIPPGKNTATTSGKSSSNDSGYKGAHGFLLTYRGSVKAPFGIGLGGIGKKMGFYGAFRFSSRPMGLFDEPYISNSSHQIIDGYGDSEYVYTEYQVETRGAFTLGLIIPFKEYLSFFGGIGIGWSNQWELYDVYDSFDQELDSFEPQIYAINEDETIGTGLEIEFGAMAHWNVFNVTAGLSMIKFKSPDFVIGVGFLFD